jgi:amino acid adenylation domain-containing protein
MQQGMLYHAAQGAVGVDLQQVTCELEEEIDPALFEQAWRETIERHAVLRTGFEWRDGAEPRQVVQPMSRVRLAFHYAEFGDEREARLGLSEYLAADRANGFPTLTAPLLRVALLRGGVGRSWFVVTYHHVLLDARSMALMFREAMERHEALAGGQALELPAARPYRHYIEWLQTLDHRASEAFWREHLKGFPTPTSLPVMRPAAGVEADTACGELMFRLTAAQSAMLRALARKHGVTTNTLVQAAWSLVLSRYSGESDVVFGALRACRHVPVEGVDAMIGLFINTVPVRARIDAQASVETWLRELRGQWIAMRPHEHTPLANVQQWSEVPPGRALFDTLLNFQEPSWDAALNALGEKWTKRRFDIHSRPGYPLSVDVYGDEVITTKAFYERERLDDDSAARLLGHFRNVLEALAANRAEKVADLLMLSPVECTKIVTSWNNTRAEYPRTVCVHREFEAQVEAGATRIAVTDRANALTYGELNARANRLAHRLVALGIGRDALVAVCMERATEMLVAWLAALKAGSAFVPLDPGYPKERLAFQIADCGARVLLTQAKTRAALPSLPTGVTVLEVAADGSGFGAESDQNPATDADPAQLAYVIYTSGSTGQPKGVQIEHRALMNLVSWHQRAYAITSADRATHLASPAFDASVWEIWPYLTAGASVHIPDDETRLSPAQLWRWMAEKKITVSFMPTPLAEAALSEPWPTHMALRALLTGGDKLKRRPPESFPCALVNHYGPTESTVVATCAAVDVHATDAQAPTIGGPIANTTAYVLDRSLRVVPVGVPGELYIGGESLARGYLKRPELDAEKFVRVSIDGEQATLVHGPETAAPANTQRLYRTGDLVRWSAAGQLEFLGRIDGQVKIRGCRIELGEIEATLQGHVAVREGLVLARPDERGQLQLIAYVVLNPGAPDVGEGELIDFLRGKLPGYMVPLACVRLDAWPLTPNGKIDRKALPAPTVRISCPDTDTAPQSATEKIVAKVWSDVLAREQVGRDDNFFDLGGHSLLAAQVIARINAVRGTPVSVRVLFDQPTLAGFSSELDRQAEKNGAVRPPLQRLKRRAARPELELQTN